MDIEIVIKNSMLVGCAIAAVTAYLLPFVLCFVWKRMASAKLFPAAVGVIAYMFISFIRGILRMAVLSDSLKHNKLLAYLVLALTAGVCEEVGRYVVFKFIIPTYDNFKDSVSYGIGHGGLEEFMVYAVDGIALSGLMLGISYRRYGLLDFDISTAEAAENTRKILENISGISFGYCMSIVYECVSAMAFHIAMSVIVFAAVHYLNDGKKMLAVAIVIHTVMNFIKALPLMGVITNSDKIIIDFFCTAALCFFAYKVYSKVET